MLDFIVLAAAETGLDAFLGSALTPGNILTIGTVAASFAGVWWKTTKAYHEMAKLIESKADAKATEAAIASLREKHKEEVQALKDRLKDAEYQLSRKQEKDDCTACQRDIEAKLHIKQNKTDAMNSLGDVREMREALEEIREGTRQAVAAIREGLIKVQERQEAQGDRMEHIQVQQEQLSTHVMSALAALGQSGTPLPIPRQGSKVPR